MYIDYQLYHQLSEEVYDVNLRRSKVVHIELHPAEITLGEGLTPLDASLIEIYWDVQNDDVSDVFTANPEGKTNSLTHDKSAPPEFNNVFK
jgi:hypothetical protein